MDHKDNKPTTPTEDDDPITTSTDSEIFGTWTVVREKNKSSKVDRDKANNAEELTKYVAAVDEAANRVEELKRDEQPECEQQDAEELDNVNRSLKSEHESSLDDFSDGISIISDSDSAGRITPHPLLRQQLSDLNLKIITAPEFELPPLKQIDPLTAATTSSLRARTDFQLKQRRRKRSSSSNALQATAAEITTVEPLNNAPPVRFAPIVRKGLTGLFYAFVLLAIVSFVGRLYNPAWGPTADTKPLVQLEQRLNDMELQNNLMRAEIDILTKQVNYLSSSKEQQSFKGKTYKMKPSLDINAEQQVFNNVEQVVPATEFVPSKTMSDFVKLADELEKLMDTPNPAAAKSADNLEFTSKAINNKQNDQQDNESELNKPYNKGEKNYERKLEFKFNKDYSNKYHEGNPTQRQSHPNSKENNSKEKFRHKKYYKEHGQESHEHDSHEDDDDDDDDDDDSKEHLHKQRFAKYQNEHNSRERFNKHERQTRMGENHSKEHAGKNFKVYDESYKKNGKHSPPVDNKDGNWHEQYMEHRANERRINEKQRNDKNWYIERGDSREQVRHVDHHFR